MTTRGGLEGDRGSRRPRARELGVVLGRLPPGPLNAITDVGGVAVGHTTIMRGDPPGTVVRTGVTAVVPHQGNVYRERVRAGHFVFNGYGKTTGLAQVGELGVLETPILLTNTLSVWTAADALVTYTLERNPEVGLTGGTVNPVVGECSDAYLNDLRGRHVTERDCLAALEAASGGPVAEGAVGAGTGMSCLGFKGGVGTSSRVLTFRGRAGREAVFVMGCLVVSNFGRLGDFRLDGVPVGAELEALGWPRRPAGPPATVEEEGRPAAGPLPPEAERHGAEENGGGGPPGGSIMVILATDLPLTARQLTRVARRAALGLARTGSVGAHGSGDFILAFSTADPEPAYPAEPVLTARRLAEDDRHFGPIFRAAVEATEEAIVNSLFAARTVVGRDGHVREALPVGTVLEILERHGRLGRSG